MGFSIVHAIIEHKADLSDTRAGEKTFNVIGSEDANIINELVPTVDEYIVRKTRLCAFFGTDLLQILHSKGIQGVAVTGLELRACVMATYIDAYQNDFRPSAIISDAVLDRREDFASYFLSAFRGEDFISTTDEWIARRW